MTTWKGCGRLNDANAKQYHETPRPGQRALREKIASRYEWLEQQLGSKTYLMGDTFTAADAYLYAVTRWAEPNGIELKRWPTFARYIEAITARPRVQEALKAEGLIE